MGDQPVAERASAGPYRGRIFAGRIMRMKQRRARDAVRADGGIRQLERPAGQLACGANLLAGRDKP
jgi:hypothetical protein